MLLQLIAKIANIKTILKLIKHTWLSNCWKVFLSTLLLFASTMLTAAFFASWSASDDVGGISAGYAGVAISLTTGRMETQGEVREGSVFALLCFCPIVLLIRVHKDTLIMGPFEILLDHVLEVSYFFRMTYDGLTVDWRFGIHQDFGQPYVGGGCCLGYSIFVALVQTAWHSEWSFDC